MTTPTPWTLTSPLPDGALLLEASAGTGKTYQMEALVLRLVVEAALPIDQLLVITFTRAAAAELRGRIRDRLAKVRDVLSNPPTPPAGDDILERLPKHWRGLGLDDTTLRARVEAALDGFDGAMISTIHSFTQDALTRFALEAHAELDARDDVPVEVRQRRLLHDALGAIGTGLDVENFEIVDAMGLFPPDMDEFAKAVLDTRRAALRPEPEDPGARPAEAAAFRDWVDRHLQQYRAEQAAIRKTGVPALRDFVSWCESDEGREVFVWLPGGEKAGRAWAKGKDQPGLGKAELFGKTRTDWTTDLVKDANAALGNPSQWERIVLAAKTALKTQKNKSAKPDHEAAWTAFESRLSELYQAIALDPPHLAPDLALHLRRAWDHHQRHHALRSFDTILVDLQTQLTREADQGTPGPLTQALRARYKAALVDEFQDTDTAQWATLRHVFLASDQGHRLIAVGDPKQSIYRFRGANLHVYFGARKAIEGDARGSCGTLRDNHRSDPELLEAINALWDQKGSFRTDHITYQQVNAAKPAGKALDGAPFELRWFVGDPGAKLSSKEVCERSVVELASARIAHLIAGGVSPRDIAVLAPTHRDLAEIASALHDRGIASTRRGNLLVFDATAAVWLDAWLEALATPERDGPLRRVALTPLVGWTPRQLARATEAAEDTKEAEAWTRLRSAVREAAEHWDRRGVATTWARWARARGVLPRVVADSERDATDLLHLIEWADATQRVRRLGPEGLRHALAEARTLKDPDGIWSPRPDTDADAVQLVTVHGSKGLQYGHVILPFAWEPAKEVRTGNGQPLKFTDAEGQPQLDLHPSGADERKGAVLAVNRERNEEAFRLLYVAMTRARHQVVAWLGAYGEEKSNADDLTFTKAPLAQLLGLDTLPDGADKHWVPPFLRQDSGKVRPGFAWVFETEEDVAAPPPKPPKPPKPPEPPTLQHWDGDGKLEPAWQVPSFSSLPHTVGDAPPVLDADPAYTSVTAEPPGDAEELIHEDLAAEAEADTAHETPAAVSAPLPTQPDDALLAEAPGARFHGGTATGSWLHAVLEHVDFEHPDRALDGRPMTEAIRDAGLRHGVVDEGQHAEAARLLPQWLHTPLGRGLAGIDPDVTLSRIDAHHRADEVEFHLRVGGGHLGADSGRADEPAVRAALETAVAEPTFRGRAWLRAFLDRTTTRGEPAKVFPRIAGFLQGFIDAVYQVGDGDDARFIVCDYKTNDLSGTRALREHTARWSSPDTDRPPRLRLWHYDQPNLGTGMDARGYHLQALVYTVALHRLLQQRLGDTYDYDTHIAGHAYLFLRGMQGEQARRDADGRTLGVWLDRWPRATVEGMSKALGGSQ